MVLASRVDFREHRYRLGSDEAARTDFHRMLTSLIQVQHPTATEVRANPGDWGIDTFVGSLVDRVNIWQSKYFIDGLGDAQKAQIRESLKSAMTNAEKNHYTVESWTLCVPWELTAPERQWWDRKVREWKREHLGVVFDLWDPPRLRGYLMSPDAHHVLQEFYGPSRDWTETAGPVHVDVAPLHAVSVPPVVPLPADEDYEGTLFVAQLAEAGLVEIDAQKTAFFNAEILARDVGNRGVPEEIGALAEIDTDTWALWEEGVAAAGPPQGGDVIGHAQALFVSVMKGVRMLPAPSQLPVRPVHNIGMMHRVVESGRAGWVVHWRVITSKHSGSRSTPEPTAPAMTGGVA